MTRNKPLMWKLGVASLSLFISVAVYSFARNYPPEILAPFQATHTLLAAQTAIFGSAPAFLYTLALGLFIGACASTVIGARVHCLIWTGLALCLELTQHPILAESLSPWLEIVLFDSSWDIVHPYWIRGTFDPLDLLATAFGGIIALALITYLPRREKDALSS